MTRRSVLLSSVLAVPLLCVAPWTPIPISAQGAEEILADKGFVTPPDPIARAVLAPRYLNVALTDVSPDRAWFVHEVGDGPVTMDRFSKPWDELGGLFIDHRANRQRTLTIRSNVGIRLLSAADGSSVDVAVPEGARVSNATWSPDGSRIAFFVHTPAETHVYVADPASGASRRVSATPVLATLHTTLEWTGDGREIATVVIPDGRAARPTESRIPAGPRVKQTEDGENMLRTYASLMGTPYEEELLEWHATGQLVLLDVETGTETRVGAPVMIWSVDVSPDGRFARVEILRRPFSYIVPVQSFGRVEQIWDREGRVLAEVREIEMRTGIDGNRPNAPGVAGSGDDERLRQIAWREDGRGLSFLQRVPDEDDETSAGGRERADRPDRVMLWAPPFAAENLSVLYRHEARISSHRFSADHRMLFIREGEQDEDDDDRSRRGDGRDAMITEYAIDLGASDARYVLARYDPDDFHADPGRLLLEGGRVPDLDSRRFRRGEEPGARIVQLSADGDHVFFHGNAYDSEPMDVGPRNFMDRVEIRTGARERIYESSNDGQWEFVTAALDVDEARFVVSRETPTEVAQSYLVVGDRRTRLTDNTDYTPEITNAPRQRFTVERPDGFRFLVNVTLPPGYTPGERLPAMFWFYPREYEDQESYDERGRTYNRNAFPNFGTRSMQYLVTLGYAVIEPDAPIVGEEGRINNNYEHDLRNNLAAVIDELDARQIIDRRRLGIGGHSYGAFGTVNAMVHTPFFKAGIAGDGNYNRTFTPLRFQNEDRIFWDAKEVYLGMSPFMFANNLTGALLLYHGLHDQNVGTAPDHSPRLFHALNGLGKKAAMYLYPYEDHGPASHSTLLDLWGRWTAWLEVHLADPDEKPVT